MSDRSDTPAPNTAAEASALIVSTKVEEEFISPLTAIRGNLEVLRDFPDLMPYDRKRFIAAALAECARLEAGISHLAGTVYAAARRAGANPQDSDPGNSNRIHVMADAGIIDLDFSDLEFSSADQVNAFYDALDQVVLPSGQTWYFIANHRGCRVWPEAWVAFAHRGKRAHVSFSKGTVKYIDGPDPTASRDMAPSREAALAQIAQMKANV